MTTGWTGLLPVFGRLALVAVIVAAAASALVARLKKRTTRPVKSAVPQRRSLAELATLVERSTERPYSRDLCVERLRALARDTVALSRGLDDAAAREAVEEGGWAAEPELLAFLTEDYLGSKGRDDLFTARLAEALDAIERIQSGTEGEKR